MRPYAFHGHDIVRATAPPIIAFLGARLVLVLASLHAGKGFPGSGDLTRADSFNYISIGAHGYVLRACPPHCVVGVGLPWSGNAGWFPLYPLALAPLVPLIGGAAAGTLVAAVCQLGTFALLWFGFLRDIQPPRALGLMALAAVFPGAVYLAAVFPLSMLTMIFLAGLWLVRRMRGRGTVWSAFFATLAYPLGCLYAPAVLLSSRRRTKHALLAVAATIGALALIAIAQSADTGHWNAYLLAQKGRGNGVHNPLTPLLSAKSSTLSFLHHPSRLDAIPSVQVSLVLLILVGALVAAVGSHTAAFDRCIAILLVLCWAEPLVLGGISLYRTDVALLPAVILLRRLSLAVIAPLVMVAAPIAYWMSVLYFEGRLN